MSTVTKKKKKMTKAQRNKIIFLICFLAIPTALLLLFTYYPALKLLQLSFMKWDGYSPDMKFVGLDNFKAVLKDKDSLMCFENNVAYIIASLIQTVIAFYIAVVLNGKIRARNFFRSVVFMPYVLNGVAVAYMFNYFYDYEEGPLNVLLRAISNGEWAVSWLGMGYSINFALAFIAVWRYTGLNVVIFLGALQSISPEYYEAAALDGSTFLQNVRYITMPLMRPMITLALFLSLSGAMQAFFEPFVLTSGGPGSRSSTFAVKILNVAFTHANYGKAAAMSVLLFAIILVILIIQKLPGLTRSKD